MYFFFFAKREKLKVKHRPLPRTYRFLIPGGGWGGILALPIMAYYGEIPPKRGSFSGLRYMKCSGRSRGETQGAQAPLSQGLDDPPPPPLIWRSGSASEMVRISQVKYMKG